MLTRKLLVLQKSATSSFFQSENLEFHRLFATDDHFHHSPHDISSFHFSLLLFYIYIMSPIYVWYMSPIVIVMCDTCHIYMCVEKYDKVIEWSWFFCVQCVISNPFTDKTQTKKNISARYTVLWENRSPIVIIWSCACHTLEAGACSCSTGYHRK